MYGWMDGWIREDSRSLHAFCRVVKYIFFPKLQKKKDYKTHSCSLSLLMPRLGSKNSRTPPAKKTCSSERFPVHPNTPTPARPVLISAGLGGHGVTHIS